MAAHDSSLAPPGSLRMSIGILLLSLSLSTTQLDRITVSARGASANLPPAVALDRLDADVIAGIGATHPADSLNRFPAVWISRGSGQELLTSIRSPVLTGPGACGAFLLLDDGVPIRPAGLCNVNMLFELDTEQAGSIEVLRGPGTPVHGANALHGVIEVHPKTPSDGPRQSLAVAAGSNVYRRLDVGLARPGDRGDWRLDALAVHSGSFRVDEGYDQQKLVLQGRLPLAPGAPKAQLALSHLDQKTAGFVFGADAFRDMRRRQNLNPEAFRNADAARMHLRWQWPIGAASRLDLTPYVRYERMHFLQHFNPGKPDERSLSRSFGSQVLFRRQGTVDLAAGVDLEWARGDLRETQTQAATGSAAAVAIRPLGRHYDYTVHTFNSAVHGQLEYPIGALRLLVGGRVERLHYDYDNRVGDGNLRDDGSACEFGGCLFNRPADRGDGFVDRSAQVALQWRMSPTLLLNARFAHAFRFPQASELYRLQRGQDVADLDPERLRGPELGLRWQTASLNLALDAWRYRKTNVIGRDALGFNFADGKTRHHGVDANAELTLAASWTLHANLGWARHRYAFDRTLAGGERITRGNIVDTAPEWLGSARLTHDATRLGRFELEWLHVGAYWLDAANSERYRGHDLLHLRWRRAITRNWQVGARLMNLADRRYAERGDFAFGQLRWFPGAGRSLFVDLRWQNE